jgi:hypothetical protein
VIGIDLNLVESLYSNETNHFYVINYAIRNANFQFYLNNQLIDHLLD